MNNRRINGPLRPNPVNPRYFADEAGRAVYLTGSHTWNNLIDMGPGYPPMEFDFGRYLDVLEDLHHNFIRLWTWDSLRTWNPMDRVRPLPWPRTGPGEAVDGQPKLNLKQHDEEYFRRLRERVAAAQERGIYVSVMLFESWEAFRRWMKQLDVLYEISNEAGPDSHAWKRAEVVVIARQVAPDDNGEHARPLRMVQCP